MPWFFAAVACCVATVVWCRAYIRRTYDAIDAVLDHVLQKDDCLRTAITGESRLSKLTHKAQRVMHMYILEATRLCAEKDTIQGFIADMSHQMKTPLSGIAMYADLLLEGDLSPEAQQAFLSRSKASTEKLQWMMNSLIKMSRLEVGAIWLSPVAGSIRQTIADAIGSIVAAASKKNIDIIIADFNDQPLLHDRKWTREAIVIVLENAVKYTADDGAIHIAVESMPLYTKIVITDNGIGINQDEWHLIFKRFYRGQNVKDTEGSGLGLYLAALIMEKQGGYIMVNSEPGRFTSFSLFLQNCKD